MSKILRKTLKLFGSSAPAGKIKQFGSFAAGVPLSSTDPAVIQALANYLQGWSSAIMSNNAPALEDENAMDYLHSYMLNYLMQAGIPEWDSATTYYIGSFAQAAGVAYTSLIDDNTGNSVSDPIKWKLFRPGALNPQVTATLAARASQNWSSSTPSSGNLWDSVISIPENKRIVAVAADDVSTASVMVSDDGGATWTGKTAAGAYSWNALAWSPEKKRLVAVSSVKSGAAKVMYSDDYGETWTLVAAAANQDWYGVTWAAELGLFVAVGSAGAIMTSTTGATWTSRTCPNTNDYVGITWSPTIAKLVAVSSSGMGDRTIYSTDGINWTVGVIEDCNWGNIVWAPELRLFVAVAFSGTNRVATSFDGINFTGRTAAAANAWLSIAWSGELGVLVAVSNSGTNRVMTSTNGVTWAIYASADDSRSWTDVCWSPQTGRFVAVATSGHAMGSRYVQKFIAA